MHCLASFLFYYTLFYQIGAEENCGDASTTILEVTKTAKNVSVLCQGRKIQSSTSTAKPVLELYAVWRSGDRDDFRIKDAELFHSGTRLGRKEDEYTKNGTAKQHSFVTNGQIAVIHDAHYNSTGVPTFYIRITFNYTLEMDSSRFKCKTRCGAGIVVEKLISTTYPRKKCDSKRYRFEYPCKYVDYLDLQSGGTCIKMVKDAVSWREAKERCVHRYNGNLIKITSSVMNDAINKLVIPPSTGYWIGLSNIRLRHLHYDEFSWLDETKSATYMNSFKTSLAPSTGDEWCVITEPGDYWHKTKCYPDKHEFICQKISARNPGPPSLSFKFSHGHRHAYIGYDLHAQCSAFTELGASVKFRMEDNINLTEIGSQGVGYTSLAEEEFVEIEDRCLPRSRAELKIKLTKRMLRTDFKCCWYLQEKLGSCSDKKRADLRYLPKRPVLTVESSYYLSIGDHVTATCSACVGTGGQLVWALDRLPKTFQWSSDFESTQDSPPSPGGLGIIPQTTWLFEDRNGTNISWSVIEDSVCGPYINSTFERLVGNDLHGAVLVCFTSNPDTISVSKAEVTVRSSVFSVNGYKDPVWTDKIGLRLVLLLVGLFILPLCGIFLFFGAPCGKNQPGRPWRRLRMRNYRAGYPKGKDASKQARPKECIKVPPQMSCPRALSKTQKPSNDKAVVTSKLGDKRKQSANSKHSGKSSKSSGFSEGSDEKDEESM